MHIWIIINGVAENPPDDPPIDEGGQSIAENIEASNPANITKTFYVSDTPENIKSFEKMVEEWVKHHRHHH